MVVYIINNFISLYILNKRIKYNQGNISNGFVLKIY